jgi:hypothetical protein
MANNLKFDRKVAVVSMLAEGSSMEAISRITGVNPNTIMWLGKRVGDACAKIHDEKVRGLNCKQIEVDEIWGFVGKKRNNATAKDEARGLGDVWTWVALDADTKLIPSYVVGKGYEEHFGTKGDRGWLFELGQDMAGNKDVLPVYLKLLSIPSVGPKIAAFIGRDLTWIFNCENDLRATKDSMMQMIMLQPVDTWIRQISELLWPQFKDFKGKADFLIAAQIVSVMHQLQESGVAFNQGSWHFASRELLRGETLEVGLQRLANEPR